MTRRGWWMALALSGCITALPEVDDPCAVWDEPGIYKHKIDVNGETRKAYVYVPATEGPRDLVMALHGAGKGARSFSDRVQFIKRADARNYVAAFPEGRSLLWVNGWNAGSCCGNVDEDSRDIDDTAFLDALAADLSVLTCTDRVLGTGFSNGGMMAHRWACEGDGPDVVVPVSGQLHFAGDCGGDPVPIRHYHGTADPTVPLEGRDGGLSVEETMEVWRQRNHCLDEPPVETVTGPMTCSAWACDVPTEQCLIEGWDHRWPGGANASAIGDGINVTVDALDFLDEAFPVSTEQGG